MRRRGLEWIHRLVQEPRRLARRYLVDNLPFVRMLFLNALWNRLTGRAFSPRPVPTLDAAQPARQFMFAVDGALCLLLILIAHGPLLAFGIMRAPGTRSVSIFSDRLGRRRTCRLHPNLRHILRPPQPPPLRRSLPRRRHRPSHLRPLLVLVPWHDLTHHQHPGGAAYRAPAAWLLKSLLPASLIFLSTLPPPFQLDDKILLALRGVAIHGSSRILDSLGVLHVISGNLIEIPGRRLFVAEACSGINSAISSLSFAVACAMFMRRRVLHTLLLTLLALLFAIAGNIFRIALGTALIEWFNYDIISGWQHEIIGLVIFSLCAFLIVSADRLLAYLLTGISGPRLRQPAHFHWQRLGWPVKSLVAAQLALGTAAAILIAPHVLWHWPAAGISNLPADAHFTLPDSIGPWIQIPTPKDLAAETTGKQSQFWSYSNGTESGTRVIIALDYPFMAYHDLTDCYQSQGWTPPLPHHRNGYARPTRRSPYQPSRRKCRSPLRPARRTRPLACLHTKPVSQGKTFSNRLALSGRVASDPHPSYQMQALLPEDHP